MLNVSDHSKQRRQNSGRVRRRGLITALALVLAAGAFTARPAQAQQVDVRFALPQGPAVAVENYGPGESNRGTLIQLTRIMQELGKLYLKPGDQLDLTVLDFNIAGIRPQGYGVIGGPDIVTGDTPPFIRLAYVLHRNGRVVTQGVSNVTDPNFLITQNPAFSSGPLYYEKRILTDWFADKFEYKHQPSAVSR